MKPGPKRVDGGIDHGSEWESISISAEADPVSVACGIKDSFNEAWLRVFVHHLKLDICELCGDVRCMGSGVGDDPCDNVRASGECICETCGMQYYDHPLADDLPGYDGPFLHRLCDGQLVKL